MSLNSYFVGLRGFSPKSILKAVSQRSPLFDQFHGIEDDRFVIRDTPQGYAELYAYSTVMWRCVNVIADTFAALPIVAKNNNGDVLEKHPLLTFVDKKGTRLRRSTAKDMLIFGTAFWVPLRSYIRRLNPLTMEVEKDVDGIRFFRQTVIGHTTVWEPDEIIYFFDYDPGDDLGSVSPTKLALRSVGVELGIESFVNAFFENDATPAGLLTTEQILQQPEQERYAAWWKKLFQGARNSHKTAILGNGLSFQQLTMPIKDMVVDTLYETYSRRICQAYGVPLTMALATDAANYSCLPAGELVYTPDGGIPIEQVVPGQIVWAWSEKGIAPRRVEASIKQPYRAKVFEIKTQHRTLRASDNHLVLTIDIQPGINPVVLQVNNYKWKRVDEIERGDFIVEAWDLPDCDRGMARGNGEPISCEFMELAGLYLADGSTSDGRSLHFAVPDDDMGRYYEHISSRLFTYVKPELRGKPIKPRRVDSSFGFTVGSASAYREFESLGLLGTAYTKRVPSWVFGLSRDHKIAFLRGFLDGDGSVGNRGAGFAGSNDALINDLRVLAISCGLRVTNMQYSDRKSNFGDCHLAKFNVRDVDIVGSNDPRYKSKIEVRKQLPRFNGQNYRGVVRQIELPDGININKVQSITYLGKMEVYDLSVEDDHTFIASGVVVHNTSKEQHQSFYTETLLPFADKIYEEVNLQLSPMFGGNVRLEVDTAQIDVLQEDRAEITTRASTGFTGGYMTMNDARRMEKLPPVAGGDVYQIAGQLVTEANLAAGKLPTPQAALPFMSVQKSTRLPDRTIAAREGAIVMNFANNPALVKCVTDIKADYEDSCDWCAPSDYHATLVYIEDGLPETFKAIGKALSTYSVDGIDITVTGSGAFDKPDEHNLHLTVASNELSDLQAKLYELVKSYGVDISAFSDPQQWKPHVSIAYGKQPFSELPDVEPFNITPYGCYLSVDADGGYAIIGATKQHAIPQAKTIIEGAALSQAEVELKQWCKKASNKNRTTSFKAHYIPSALADFIRMDLAAGEHEVKAIFDGAMAHIKQVDTELATPEEFEAYWNGIGELYDTMQELFAAELATFAPLVASRLRELGNNLDLALVMQEMERSLSDKLVGTEETPGVLTKIVLAGSARGNDLLENARLTANPFKAATAMVAWDIINQQAVTWAREYAGEMIRGINATTQQVYQDKIAEWVESGGHLDELARVIEGELENLDIPEGWSDAKIRWATSPQRAAVIAQHETSLAFNRGVEQRWTQAGVKRMKWRTQRDSLVCPLCKDDLNGKEGTIAEGVKGDDGKMYKPPAHISCRCFPAPIV